MAELNSSYTYEDVITDLSDEIGVDRMFRDVTSDALYIVQELKLPVDEKQPPVLITLTEKDEPDEKMN